MSNNKDNQQSICFIAYYAYGLFAPSEGVTYGGAEVQLYQLATTISKDKKPKVVFLTSGKSSEVSQYKNIELRRTLRISRAIPIFSHITGLVRFFWQLHRSQSDIYIQRAMGPETGFAALYCKVFRKKFVYMVAHEWDVSGQFERERGLIGKLGVWGMRNASLVILQNNNQQTMLKDNYGIKGPLLSTAYEIPTDIVPMNERDGVLWVGRGETWKHPERLLDAAEALPDERFIMIMPAGNYPQQYEEWCKRAGKLSNVDFIESVPLNDIDEYFAKAKLFVNTSSMEGFPNTYIQAAKHGTPIISRGVNPDDILQKHNFGLIADTDKELIQVIQQVSNNEQQLDVMSKKAYVYAKTHHDITVVSEQFLQLVTDSI